MPIWLAIYLIVGAILGTVYTLAVLFIAEPYEDRFRVTTFAIGGALLFGLIWPVAVVLAIFGMSAAMD